ASVSATEPDPSTVNNAAVAALNASTSADLTMAQMASPAVPGVGKPVTFTMTAANNGPDAATGVVVNDVLPSGLSFVSGSAAQGTYDPSTGVWTIGTLPNGASVSLTLVANATQAGSLNNTAQVSGAQPDPNPANNSATATVTASAAADLSVFKSVDSATPQLG